MFDTRLKYTLQFSPQNFDRAFKPPHHPSASCCYLQLYLGQVALREAPHECDCQRREVCWSPSSISSTHHMEISEPMGERQILNSLEKVKSQLAFLESKIHTWSSAFLLHAWHPCHTVSCDSQAKYTVGLSFLPLQCKKTGKSPVLPYLLCLLPNYFQLPIFSGWYLNT